MMKTTTPPATVALVIAALVAFATPAAAADPAAKALKKASRAVEKTVRQEAALQAKAVRDSLNALLKDVAAESKTPGAALGEAVLAATEAAAAVSTAAFDGVTTVREGAVNDALGGAEGPVLLGTDFQAGGGGIWDDFIVKLHRHMSKLDDRVGKELWKFVGKLEKTVTKKLGDEMDAHLQVRRHDNRIDAIQCPASLAANPGAEAVSDANISQVYIEARIVIANDDFSSELGVLGFGNSFVDLAYETGAGTALEDDVPVNSSGVLGYSRVMGGSDIGPYRIDVLDSVTGERADSVGGRPPSTSSATNVNDLLKQARKAMRQDSKFFGKVTGQIRGDYRKADAGTCKDFMSGALDAEATLDQLFANYRAALAGTTFWEGIVKQNPVGFVASELISLNVSDQDIPDDLAADAGGAFTKHIEKVGRRTEQRLTSFQRISERSISRILKKLAKNGQEASVLTRSPRYRSPQGPTVSTLQAPVVQLEVVPHIVSATTISLELAPTVVESAAYLTGRTPDADPTLAITSVNLAEGDTVVLGGLVSSPGDNTFQQKVPLLGDLPLIGRLFRVKSMDQADTDTVVIVTPMLFKDSSS